MLIELEEDGIFIFHDNSKFELHIDEVQEPRDQERLSCSPYQRPPIHSLDTSPPVTIPGDTAPLRIAASNSSVLTTLTPSVMDYKLIRRRTRENTVGD